MWPTSAVQTPALGLSRCRLLEPVFDLVECLRDGQVLVDGPVFLEIGTRQAQERAGRSQPALLDVNQCAGQLNEALIECTVGLRPLRQPDFFQNFVGFEEELAVEAIEECQVLGRQALSQKRLDQGGGPGCFGGHDPKIEVNGESAMFAPRARQFPHRLVSGFR